MIKGKMSIRSNKAYSLIETMTIIAVLGIVIGLLYAYSNEGWKMFFQSYSRGLSQVKAKLAVRLLAEDLREANKSRVYVGRGSSVGVPFPDDFEGSAAFIYFTKPVFIVETGDVVGYDYVLYYFAKQKEIQDLEKFSPRKKQDKIKQSVLKVIKFKNQSKFYTEDKSKEWPFMPPILEIHKSRLPEDEEYVSTIEESIPKQEDSTQESEIQTSKIEKQSENLFLDHFAQLKEATRNIPVSGNFSASLLTEPFLSESVSFILGQEYKNDKIIKIKFEIEEPPLLLGLMSAKSDIEVKITPRN